MHRFVWCGCEEVKKVSANECVLFFCAHKKRIGCEKQFQRTLPMLKLSLTYALFLSAPTTCARARALLSHTMHLICTYSAVFYTNSIQTFSINSSRVCVSQTMQSFLLLACLPFTHFRLFTRSVVMCTCICFQQIIRVLHSTLICLKFIQKKEEGERDREKRK